MKNFRFKVTAKENGEKIDRALVLLNVELSRKKIRLLLDKRKIQLNGKPVGVASKRVKTGDIITASYQVETLKGRDATGPAVDLTPCYLYKRGGVIVFNKPPGIPVQKTKSRSLYNIEDMICAETPGYSICHRLDKETSGILVLANSPESIHFI